MAFKRPLSSGPDDPPRKRSKKQQQQQQQQQQQPQPFNPSVDPSTGQRFAFTAHGRFSTTVPDTDLEFEDDIEAVVYLTSVRYVWPQPSLVSGSMELSSP